jgi:hypothetical protein
LTNGDFNLPFVAWPSTPGWSIPPGYSGLAEIVPGYGTNATAVAHLKAAGDFTYSNGYWQGATQQAIIQQMFTVGAGQSTLLFDAVYSASGIEVGNAFVTYTAFGGGAGTRQVAPGTSWGTYELPLLNGLGQPITTGTPVLLSVILTADAPSSTRIEAQRTSQLAEGYFDNFRFASGVVPGLIPEPLTVVSAFLAIGSLSMYIRKRAASPA